MRIAQEAQPTRRLVCLKGRGKAVKPLHFDMHRVSTAIAGGEQYFSVDNLGRAKPCVEVEVLNDLVADGTASFGGRTCKHGRIEQPLKAGMIGSDLGGEIARDDEDARRLGGDGGRVAQGAAPRTFLHEQKANDRARHRRLEHVASRAPSHPERAR
eukprot:CAMPEP_0174753620 /NCGR_PEP_ID=MMETSP1094-20130205/104380_1 /TAXON_ID=156173 /ORGANISM="Chrysochromulina brevifilum, Strain UTEX LB 985" /LENGTH=155 /DNA_ID=CAMNT_0015959419 /DNA_START=163 /DNA_END=631 /DNA_ORIENTATION=+